MNRYQYRDRPDILLKLIERDGPYCMGVNKETGKRCLEPLWNLKQNDIHIHHTTPIDQAGDREADDISIMKIHCRKCHADATIEELKQKASDNHNIVQTPVCVGENGRRFAKTLAEARDLAGKGGRVYLDQVKGGYSFQTAADLEQERKDAEALREAKENDALTPVMRVNKRCEKPFNEWMSKLIRQGWKYDFETWTNAGAQEFKCSPETIRKYLNKRTNPINGDLFTRIDDDGHGNKDSYLAFRDKYEN